MLISIKAGDWLPDMAPHLTDGMTTVRNVYAQANGYGPVKSFSPITPALPERFAGGAAYVGSDGTAALLAGTANKLLRYSGSSWDVLLTALSVDRWRFTQFGDLVIAVNGGVPRKFNLLTGTASTLGGSPPAGTLVATVRDFIVMAGDPADVLDVRWSGFNNAEQWDGTNQSNNQPMLDGGRVMGLAGGEYGIILQQNAIKRMSYVGAPIVFQIDEIARDVGCMAEGSVAQWGRLTFFLSERGFMVCDGNEVKPIGDEKIDRTFFTRYSREDLKGLYTAVDPRRSLVMWSMPGKPGTIWCYNWNLGRWTTIETDVRGILTGFTANVSIDALDAMYGNLDAVPVSLDDPKFSGGNPLLMVATTGNVIGALAGSNMAAQIGFSFGEPGQGRRVRMRRVQPIADATMATVTIDGRQRLGDVEGITATSDMRPSGHMAVRLNARYVKPTIDIPEGHAWTFLQGLEMEMEAGARR